MSLPVPPAGRTSTFIAAVRTFTPTAAGRPPSSPLLRLAAAPLPSSGAFPYQIAVASCSGAELLLSDGRLQAACPCPRPRPSLRAVRSREAGRPQITRRPGLSDSRGEPKIAINHTIL